MSSELFIDISQDPRHIGFVNCRDIVPASPSHCPEDSTIRACRGNRFRQTEEVAQTSIGSEGHQQMNMICQNLSFDHLYAGTLTSTQSSDSHVIGCVRRYIRHAARCAR